MSILFVKQEIEDKYRLKEILSSNFEVKIVGNNLISDILHPSSGQKIYFDPEKVSKGCLLLLPLSEKEITKLSIESITKGYELKVFRDRFDLANLFVKRLAESNDKQFDIREKPDPIRAISLMTWSSDLISNDEAKIIFDEFKSIEAMFQISEEELKGRLEALPICKESKAMIKTFLKGDQDYYIT